jgi:D-serine deaminase-like pyridoxal phosphate-dependent protein
VTVTLDARFRAAVGALRARPIGICEKGFGAITPVTAADLAGRRPSLFGGGFITPVMVLRETALSQNVQGLAAFCAAAGVDLAPHGKTTMAPQLFSRQLAAGAWAMTAATAGHMQTYRSFGVPRILLANELTDPAGIAWLAAEMAADPGFGCYVYVDSAAGIRLLDETLRASGATRPLPVLVELGQPGGRTGCRSIEEAVTVAKTAAAADSLQLAGAAGYEGSIGHDCAPGTLDAIAAFCQDLRKLGGLLAGLAPGQEPLILSAGGSAYFDIVAAELTKPAAGGGPRLRAVLRSGAYISHDHGMYATLAPGVEGPRQGPQLRPAFELWASVLSRPEPGLALLNAGRRDVAFDQGYPIPLQVRSREGQLAPASGMTVTELSDQHAYLSVPADSGLAPGDLVCMGISHPCTTFDKWRVIPVVDDSHRVIDAIHTFF